MEPADHTEIMRLLAKRNHDLGRLGPSSSAGSTMPWPTSHRPGIPRRNSTLLKTTAPLGSFEPGHPHQGTCATSWPSSSSTTWRASTSRSKRVAPSHPDRGSGLEDLAHRPLPGAGPVLACSLIGYSGDVGCFAANGDCFAAWVGIAPVERSSGGRVFHRLSLRGHRRLNNAIHMVAICEIRQPHSEGRAYFDRKVAEGKTKQEALRLFKRHALQRRLSPAHPRCRKGSGEDTRKRLVACVVGSTS